MDAMSADRDIMTRILARFRPANVPLVLDTPDAAGENPTGVLA
jgi:hypothetical protein